MAGLRDVASGDLRGVPFLHVLSDPQLARLSRIAQRRRYGAGAPLFDEGDAGRDAFVIIDGALRVHRVTGDGHEVTIARLGRGDIVGELSLLDGAPRSAAATWLSDGEAAVIARASFTDWLRTDGDAAVALLARLASRLRETNESLTELATSPLHDRLARRLRALAAERPGDRIRITQSELATMLGVTREAVNKELAALRRARSIEVGRGWIRLTGTR